MAVVAEAGLEGDFDDFLVRGFQESPCGVETGREDVLAFDSDLSLHNTVHYAPTLAKDYRLEALTGGQWKLLADEKDNIRRLRVHRFAPLSAEAVRLTVTAVHGGDEVRVFEIRAE